MQAEEMCQNKKNSVVTTSNTAASDTSVTEKILGGTEKINRTMSILHFSNILHE